MFTCLNCGKTQNGRKVRKFCNSKCQQEFEYKKYIDEWKNGNVNGMRGEFNISRHIRRYLFNKYDNKCALCGWSKINIYTGNVPLEIDHIDGDYKNNNEDNLILLCPNCHSLTPTYKALNIGQGRKGRT